MGMTLMHQAAERKLPVRRYSHYLPPSSKSGSHLLGRAGSGEQSRAEAASVAP